VSKYIPTDGVAGEGMGMLVNAPTFCFTLPVEINSRFAIKTNFVETAAHEAHFKQSLDYPKQVLQKIFQSPCTIKQFFKEWCRHFEYRRESSY